MRHRVVGFSLAVAAVVLAACGPGTTTSTPDRWHRVDLGGARAVALAEVWTDLVQVTTRVDGDRDVVSFSPWLGTAMQVPRPAGAGPVLTLLPSDLGPLVLTGGRGGVVDAWSDLVLPAEGFEPSLAFQLEPPGPDVTPEAAWFGQEDEGAILSVAYGQPGGRVAVHAQDWATGSIGGEALQLSPGADLDEVRVTGVVGAVAVLDPAGGPDVDAGPVARAWIVPSLREPAESGSSDRAWAPVVAAPSPDDVTDLGGNGLDVLLAGRVEDRPAVWVVSPTEDEPGRAEALDVALPDVSLDGVDDPAVLLAEPVRLGEPFALAVESGEGPRAYLPTADGWDEFDLPSGRLQDVAWIRDARPLDERGDDPPRAGDERLLVIVDGELWSRTR